MIDDDKIGDLFEDTQRESNPLDEGKRQEQQQNGEVISDVESYGLSLREVCEEDGLRSITSNHFLGNRDQIPEAKSRVSEDEQRDDDTSNVEIYGEDKISGNDNEDEEEDTKQLPRTLISVNMHKKPLFLSKNEYVEDVRDGTILVPELDGSDPIRTIERLKETVEAEYEALRGLYAELEEERSASAIATNQKMAMITRLQEEKAKVQMEALQYKRMMEEQAEYDQYHIL